tara:strand:+ start:63 stop:476 length:414 start_codon:yes stop_codon:yes gene_type:complete
MTTQQLLAQIKALKLQNETLTLKNLEQAQELDEMIMRENDREDEVRSDNEEDEEDPFPFNDAMGRPIVLVLEDPAPVEEEEEEEVEEDQDPKLTELGIMHIKCADGKYKLYNPKTKRWIGNDARNRRRICHVNNELA